MTDLIISLAEDFSNAGCPVYCVMDGALFNDIQHILQKHHLDGQPIFRGSAAHTLVLAGPWLIYPKTKEEVHVAFSVAHDHRSGVVWCASCCEADLRRHLRTLNMARLPQEGLVYFRHYDPDVLASVCPLLDSAQAARLLGPANELAFLAGRGEGASVGRPPNLPLPETGPLSFYDWQVEKLYQRQLDLSRQKICVFLRRVLPRETVTHTDRELYDIVKYHQAQAKDLGLTTEMAITQWTHLSLMSNGEITKNADIQNLITKNGRSGADKQLDDNFFSIIHKYTANKA